MKPLALSVFTKPWKDLSPDELGAKMQQLGFDAIEFPLRTGYQVDPENARQGLPRLARTLAQYNLTIASVASDTREVTFAACQEAGVPLLRIMLGTPPGMGYLAAEQTWKQELTRLEPLCERYQVKLGIQQHFGSGVFSSMELRHVLEGFDPRRIGAIWDAAHSALAGELPEKALDILWEHLLLMNFKNAFYARVNPEQHDEQARFKPFFTPAFQGAANWRQALAYALKRGYRGALCMPAEYSETDRVLEYLAQDVVYLRDLRDSLQKGEA